MYCKSCGQKVKDYDNYCRLDGISIKEETANFSVSTKNPSFCFSCGSKVKGCSNYCTSCGYGLQTIELQPSVITAKFPDSTEKISLSTTSKLSSIRQPFSILKTYLFNPGKFIPVFKATAFGVSISLLINVMFAFIVNGVLSKVVDSVFQDALQEVYYFLPSEVSLFSAKNVLLIMYGIGINVYTSASSLISVDAKISYGLFIFMTLIAISFSIGGWYNGKRNLESDGEQRLIFSFFSGIVNVFFLFVLFFFARYNDTIVVDFVSTKLSVSYSLFDLFMRGFLFAFLFHYFGMLLSKVSPQRKLLKTFSEISNYGIHTYLAIKTLTWGMLSMLMMMVVSILISFDGDARSILVLATQYLPFFYGMLHFGNFSLTSQMSYPETANLSILNYHTNNNYYLEGFSPIVLYVGVLILCILLFMAGQRIRLVNPMISLKDVLPFGIIYSLILSSILWLSNISYNINGRYMGESEVIKGVIGTNILWFFITSMIISTLFAYVGTRLSNR